jgi:uncharacterized membrane protein
MLSSVKGVLATLSILFVLCQIISGKDTTFFLSCKLFWKKAATVRVASSMRMLPPVDIRNKKHHFA